MTSQTFISVNVRVAIYSRLPLPTWMRLVVLFPSHFDGVFAENLALHVDAILAHEAHATETTGNAACTATFTVLVGVGEEELVLSVITHFKDMKVCRKQIDMRFEIHDEEGGRSGVEGRQKVGR